MPFLFEEQQPSLSKDIFPPLKLVVKIHAIKSHLVTCIVDRI